MTIYFKLLAKSFEPWAVCYKPSEIGVFNVGDRLMASKISGCHVNSSNQSRTPLAYDLINGEYVSFKRKTVLPTSGSTYFKK